MAFWRPGAPKPDAPLSLEVRAAPCVRRLAARLPLRRSFRSR